MRNPLKSHSGGGLPPGCYPAAHSSSPCNCTQASLPVEVLWLLKSGPWQSQRVREFTSEGSPQPVTNRSLGINTPAPRCVCAIGLSKHPREMCFRYHRSDELDNIALIDYLFLCHFSSPYQYFPGHISRILSNFPSNPYLGAPPIRMQPKTWGVST